VLSRDNYLIIFAAAFVFVTTLGLLMKGRSFSSLFGGIISVCFLVSGLIPYWIALVGLFIVFVEFGSYLIRGTPQEKPSETTQKPQNQIEITGAFDKSQFKRK
jgi:hypothetical protein